MTMHAPPHLLKDYATGLQPESSVSQFELGSMRNFIYLIQCLDTKKAFLVDCQNDIEPILEELRKNKIELVGFLITHSHHDHVKNLNSVIENNPRLKVYIHEKEMFRIPPEQNHWTKNIQYIKDQEIIQLGNLKIKTHLTPGHSQGECCFEFKDQDHRYLLTGDTLFIRDCGRTDLPSGNVEELFSSIQKIKLFPEETILLPGHHYQMETTTTVKLEKEKSPVFQCKTWQELQVLP